MENLEARLAPLPARHRAALQWFVDRADEDHGWPKPLSGAEGDTLLASKAKGIYKPGWSKYALSVRQSLGGQYPDREPVVRADGTWSFSYFQENEDPSARDQEFTNRGLLECWRDKVPVGVFRQTKERPKARYRVFGVALVAGWDAGYFFLEGFGPAGLSRGKGPAAEMEHLAEMEVRAALVAGAFDPSGIIDARERVVAQIVRRRGQPAFRRVLLNAYEGRCAISGCDAPDALEAGHVSPYRGPNTNQVANGILLRADLHTLFDLGLVAIDSSTMTVVVAEAVASTAYGGFAGAPVRLPTDPNLRPSTAALDAHRAWAGL